MHLSGCNRPPPSLSRSIYLSPPPMPFRPSNVRLRRVLRIQSSSEIWSGMLLHRIKNTAHTNTLTNQMQTVKKKLRRILPPSRHINPLPAAGRWHRWRRRPRRHDAWGQRIKSSLLAQSEIIESFGAQSVYATSTTTTTTKTPRGLSVNFCVRDCCYDDQRLKLHRRI